jgi:beta-glucosidase
VVVVGSMPAINGRENDDRTDMGLAPAQEALVKAVRAANPHTVVVSSAYDYETVTAHLTDVPKGRTDVYLVMDEDIRLSTFTLR